MATGLMPAAEAEAMATRALAWLAGDEDLIGGFLASSGAGPADLRASAADPGFLGFVLDYVLADEGTLIAFASADGVRPELVARAREALPGGDLPNWT